MVDVEESELAKLQKEYNHVCARIGELHFHQEMILKDLATLKAKQFEIHDQHRLAMEKEKKQQQEAQTKQHFIEKASEI